MSEHKIELAWKKAGEFSHEGFERKHQLGFLPGVSLSAGGANNNYGADPEQLLAAAMASCHMMTFLALAAKKRLQVESYEDQAIVTAEPREDGKMWVPSILLQPKVVFSGDKQPDLAAIEAMHEKAHQHCFIANSTKSAVVIKVRNP